MIATLHRTSGALAGILVGSLLASGCAGPAFKASGAARNPVLEATIAGFGQYGGLLSDPGGPRPTAEDLVDATFYAGNEDGPLPPVTVQDSVGLRCTSIALELAPVHLGYAAYSKPAEFFALELATDLSAEVRDKGPFGASGDLHELTWRIATYAATGGKVVTLAEEPKWDADAQDALAFDTMLLFDEELGTLTYLDGITWDTLPEGGQVHASIVAAAENPFTGHLEVFVRLSGGPSTKVIVYDLSEGTLMERGSHECAL